MNRTFILYIVEAPNGKRYMGITSRTIGRRWGEHKKNARYGCNFLLHKAIRLYGAENMHVSILAKTDNWDAVCRMEVDAIAEFGTFKPSGYNLTRGGEGAIGLEVGEETRQKLRAANLGKSASAATRAKMSASRLGRKLPPRSAEWRRKQSIINTGRKASDETRRKMTAARLGRAVHSDEFKNQLAERNRGRLWSAPARAAIAESNRRRGVANRHDHPQEELFNV